MQITVIIKPIIATKYWLAPVARPIPTVKKIYVNSSGSLIGVLNLTIDNAPTSPKERAKDDFITAIIIVVPILNIGSVLAKLSGFEKQLEYLRNILERKKESKNDKIIDMTKELIDKLKLS